VRTIKVMLIDGLKTDKTDHREATLRELSVGDLLQAAEESERLIQTPDGLELKQSPTRMGIETIRRQIVSIGAVQGPLSLAEIQRLSATDLALLQITADQMDRATLEVSEQRGRTDAGGETPG